jgi:hypothetical protein
MRKVKRWQGEFQIVFGTAQQSLRTRTRYTRFVNTTVRYNSSELSESEERRLET